MKRIGLPKEALKEIGSKIGEIAINAFLKGIREDSDKSQTNYPLDYIHDWEYLEGALFDYSEDRDKVIAEIEELIINGIREEFYRQGPEIVFELSKMADKMTKMGYKL